MWDKLTVGKTQELYDILYKQQFDTDIERGIGLLSCLEGKPIPHYENMELSALREALKAIAFLSTMDIPTGVPPRRIKVGGKSFKVVYEFKHLKAGQFIDVLDAAKSVDEQIPNLHRMLAAICLEVKRDFLLRLRVLKYGSMEFDKVAEAMKEVPITTAYSIAVFFYRVWTHFLSSMPDYSKKMKMENRKATPMEMVLIGLDSSNDGDGSAMQVQ